MNFKGWFQHAFAVDPSGPVEPTDAERTVVDALLREVVRRRLTTPALVCLESLPNMNYVAAQAMHFFAPIATVLLSREQYDIFAHFLEHRGSVPYMTARLEELESERRTTNREPRRPA